MTQNPEKTLNTADAAHLPHEALTLGEIARDQSVSFVQHMTRKGKESTKTESVIDVAQENPKALSELVADYRALEDARKAKSGERFALTEKLREAKAKRRLLTATVSELKASLPSLGSSEEMEACIERISEARRSLESAVDLAEALDAKLGSLQPGSEADGNAQRRALALVRRAIAAKELESVPASVRVTLVRAWSVEICATVESWPEWLGRVFGPAPQSFETAPIEREVLDAHGVEL